MYSDADAAALYDTLNPWGDNDAFYLAHVLRARAALDVGCGTGRLLHRARDAGHPGRLTGIDPDRAALDRARRRTDAEWVAGTAADIPWRAEFDLATMASNAFQCLVTDEDVHASLTAIRAALTDDGRFVFETRNPAAEQWRDWHPGNAVDVTDHHGRELRVLHRVESAEHGLVTFTETTATRDGVPLRTDRATLRFLTEPDLRAALAEAGFAVTDVRGGWHGEPLTDTCLSIVVTAEPGAVTAR